MEKYWSNKKMLEPLKMNVNINDIYQYKLKSFFNSRALSVNEEKFIFIDSGKNKEKVLMNCVL
ncbi:hypothetical protein ACP0F6_26315, partial [Escherichia coli]|uniref:hypothetical protein n=2 Tax=Enterobacterales TaxID=91347 RepID=UPI003CF99914